MTSKTGALISRGGVDAIPISTTLLRLLPHGSVSMVISPETPACCFSEQTGEVGDVATPQAAPAADFEERTAVGIPSSARYLISAVVKDVHVVNGGL